MFGLYTEVISSVFGVNILRKKQTKKTLIFCNPAGKDQKQKKSPKHAIKLKKERRKNTGNKKEEAMCMSTFFKIRTKQKETVFVFVFA